MIEYLDGNQEKLMFQSQANEEMTNNLAKMVKLKFELMINQNF